MSRLVLDNDGQDFLCMDCGATVPRSRNNPYPSHVCRLERSEPPKDHSRAASPPCLSPSRDGVVVSDDVKPYRQDLPTEEELRDAVVAFGIAACESVRSEDGGRLYGEGFRHVTAKIDRLLATVHAARADTERAEWLLARLWYGGVDVEPEQGAHRFLKLTDDEGRLRRDWRDLIDGMRRRDDPAG